MWTNRRRKWHCEKSSTFSFTVVASPAQPCSLRRAHTPPRTPHPTARGTSLHTYPSSPLHASKPSYSKCLYTSTRPQPRPSADRPLVTPSTFGTDAQGTSMFALSAAPRALATPSGRTTARPTTSHKRAARSLVRTPASAAPPSPLATEGQEESPNVSMPDTEFDENGVERVTLQKE